MEISRPWIFWGPGKFQGLGSWIPCKFPGAGNYQGGPLDISRWCKIKFLNVGRNRHIYIKHKFESHPGWQFSMFSWNHGKKCKKRCPGWFKSWLFEKYTTFKRPKLRNSFIISLCINVTNFFPQFPLTHLLLVSRQLLKKIFVHFWRFRLLKTVFGTLDEQW